MSASDTTSTAGFRVLVADDTAANRTLVRAYLSRLGFEVLLAEDGAQALELFERERPDIVLMDVMMPVMDGLEATRRVRASKHGRGVPIVMLSALGAEGDVVGGLDAGADDYLVKPLSYQIFAAKMRTVTRGLHLQRQSDAALEEVRAISSAMSDGLMLFDPEGRVGTVNPAVCAMLGRDESALVGSLVFDLFLPPGDRLLRSVVMANRSGAEQRRAREVAALSADGVVVPLELVLSTMNASNGIMYLAVLRNISERKQAERELAAYTNELKHYHDDAERENGLALEILERQIRRGGLDDPTLAHSVVPAQRFSGDVVLAQRAPDGRLFAVLADATGHGLGAAVSVLPAVAEFYRAVAASPSTAELVAQLNHALCESLPIGRFVAAALVCVDPATRQAHVWVGGTPEVLKVAADGTVVQRFASTSLPLGIDSLTPESAECESTLLGPGEQILIFSDGLLEAVGEDGSHFGYEGVERALRGAAADQRVAALVQAAAAHCGGGSPHDDLSLLLISAG
ncbi:SpoIIE family protein phosphatase [Niveibacterium sp. 24ML]|uniref:SpoIIE family protein phosphatase n=1 Tax=Niveibacterium sp. 24ML TaxID=2985512 RepID=UPI00226E23E3|nr:SpoIIE family protein phosphatase [Niveibacterium sp. 24ML]MCX9157845.1 SpoIIE family protein phosphatase [Niveibacterium sp. 24ML]